MSTPTPPPASGPVPGWYPDPSAPAGRTGRRWWDGAGWTEHVQADAIPGTDPAAMGGAGPMGGMDPVGTTPDGQPLAGWGARLGAYLIDGLVLFVATLIIGSPFLITIVKAYGDYFDRLSASGGTGIQGTGISRLAPGASAGLLAVSLVVLVVYQAVMLKTRSATLGKLALGLRVRLRDAPGPLGWSTIGRRLLGQFGVNLLRFVPFVSALVVVYLLLDGLWPLWDAKRQSLHDKLAHTNVVRVR